MSIFPDICAVFRELAWRADNSAKIGRFNNQNPETEEKLPCEWNSELRESRGGKGLYRKAST